VCNFLKFFLFVRLRISQRRKSYGREILHACWPIIRTGLLPFCGSKVKGQCHQGQKTRLALRSPPGFRTNGMPALQTVAAAAPADECIAWRARAPRGDIGGGMQRGSKVGAAATTKAVWWDLRLASLLTFLQRFLF